ncbi:hypothetical protein LZK73_09935 [Neorhizobium galegae]|nr:hypothetical protein LZK73_09935 [Neorhizobium galegae]
MIRRSLAITAPAWLFAVQEFHVRAALDFGPWPADQVERRDIRQDDAALHVLGVDQSRCGFQDGAQQGVGLMELPFGQLDGGDIIADFDRDFRLPGFAAAQRQFADDVDLPAVLVATRELTLPFAVANEGRIDFLDRGRAAGVQQLDTILSKGFLLGITVNALRADPPEYDPAVEAAQHALGLPECLHEPFEPVEFRVDIALYPSFCPYGCCEQGSRERQEDDRLARSDGRTARLVGLRQKCAQCQEGDCQACDKGNQQARRPRCRRRQAKGNSNHLSILGFACAPWLSAQYRREKRGRLNSRYS